MQQIIKLGTAIKKIETTTITNQRINVANSWLFEKISKIHKLLFKLTKGQRENI